MRVTLTSKPTRRRLKVLGLLVLARHVSRKRQGELAGTFGAIPFPS
jgi:hypothetical protein